LYVIKPESATNGARTKAGGKGHTLKADRPARWHHLRADANLRSQAVAEAIRKTGGAIMEYTSSVHICPELQDVRIVFTNDAFSVL